jgi:phosphate transport system substrate-binding protein
MSDPAMTALKDSDESRFQAVCTEVRSDGKYVDQGEQDNLIVQKIESNPDAVGVFGYSYLEENLDKVQGETMNGVEPTYDNIASFAYPGARPLFIYVKKAHLDVIPGLKEFIAEWARSWDRGGPLAKVGLVAMPAEAMAANQKAASEFTTLDGAQLK